MDSEKRVRKRVKTNYPGVYYRVANRIGHSGEERVYYIVFKKDGKVFEEKVGRQYVDSMTPAKAAGIRADRVENRIPSRKQKRQAQLAAIQAEKEKVTIQRLWNLYEEANSNRKCRKTDLSIFKLHLSDCFSVKTPQEIETKDIDTLKSKLVASELAPQTVKHILALLHRLIQFGVKRGLCPTPDPSRLIIEMPVIDNEQTETMSSEQLKEYLKALDEEPDQDAAAFLRLALVTGMRKGALLGLKWSDIDFEKGFITLRGETAKKGRTELIPMTQTAKGILEGISRVSSDFVFPGKPGDMQYSHIAKRVRDTAKLPPSFRPLHGLRHVYASLLASSGKVDLYTLQKLLTHNNPQMTQRYAHLADEALKRAAEVIDEALPTLNIEAEK